MRPLLALIVIAFALLPSPTKAEAEMHTMAFDDLAVGSVVTGGPGGVTFPDSPIVFRPPGKPAATASPPNALRRAGDCPDQGAQCTSGDHRLVINFAVPARSVSMKVGTVEPDTCFELDCPFVKAVAYDLPSNEVVARTGPVTVTNASLTFPLALSTDSYSIDRVVYSVGEDPETGSSTSTQWTAQIDDLAYDVVDGPSVTIESPADGAELDTTAFALTGRVGVAAGLDEFCVTVDAADIPSDCDQTSLVNSKGSFSVFPVPGAHPGINQITVWARDGAGRLGADTVTVNVAPVEGIEPFKVMSYNVQFLTGPPGVREEYRYGIQEEDRARIIARYITGSGADVVALNELFAEDARDVTDRFLDEDDYPFRAKKIGGATPFKIDDSGLALFSKFPFVRFSVKRRRGRCERGSATSCTIAFLPYGACSGTIEGEALGLDERRADCPADKGAAYARLENPSTGRILHVFFTHTDAGRTGSDRRARTRQLRDLTAMIGAYAGDDDPIGDTVVMGDLNVRDCSVRRCGADDDEEYDRWTNKLSRDLGFDDVVRADGFPADHAATSKPPPNTRQDSSEWTYGEPSEPGWRLDYMFIRDPAPELCASRVLIENDLVTERFLDDDEVRGSETSLTSLSDHEPTVATFGSRYPGCSAGSAIPLSALPATVSHPLPENGVRWYVYDPRGAGFDGPLTRPPRPDSRLRTYVADPEILWPAGNLIQVSAFEINGDSARTLNFGDPAVVASRGRVYLRVRENGLRATDYSMSFDLTEGRYRGVGDLVTASALDPFGFREVNLPAGESRIFRLPVEHPHSGAPVPIRAAAFPTSGERPRLELQDITGTVLESGNGALEHELPGPPYRREPYFLVVESRSPAAGTAAVSWGADTATLDLYKLWCQEQEDHRGDDSIYMRVKVDGGEWTRVNLGSFDVKQAKFMPRRKEGFEFHNLTFQDELAIQLKEVDDGENDLLGHEVFRRRGGEIRIFRRRGDELIPEATRSLTDAPLRQGSQFQVRFNRDDADYRLFFWASAL